MLMVESASIDKQSHARKPCGHIGELGQLDDAVRIALNYATTNPETLVLVTADHGHAAHIIAETSDFLRQNFATPGRLARVRTPEGGIMGVNYASTDFPGWEQHSGVQIPLVCQWPRCEGPARICSAGRHLSYCCRTLWRWISGKRRCRKKNGPE